MNQYEREYTAPGRENQPVTWWIHFGEMIKRGCSVPTAEKIWEGKFEEFEDFKDNDLYLSKLRKAAAVLRVKTGALLPR